MRRWCVQVHFNVIRSIQPETMWSDNEWPTQSDDVRDAQKLAKAHLNSKAKRFVLISPDWLRVRLFGDIHGFEWKNGKLNIVGVFIMTWKKTTKRKRFDFRKINSESIRSKSNCSKTHPVHYNSKQHSHVKHSCACTVCVCMSVLQTLQALGSRQIWKLSEICCSVQRSERQTDRQTGCIYFMPTVTVVCCPVVRFAFISLLRQHINWLVQSVNTEPQNEAVMNSSSNVF